MGTTIPTEITCWACGKPSIQDVIMMASVLGEDLDGRPHRTIEARYLVQECPHCGYCAGDLSTAAPGAEAVIASEPYRAQLRHPAYPMTANRFLCWGMVREAVGTEQDSLAFVLNAAWACEQEHNPEKAGELRVRAARLMITREAQTGKEAGADDIIIADLFRRAGAFDDAIKQCDTGLAKDVDPRIRDRLTLERDLARWRDTGPHSTYEGSDPGPRPERGPHPGLGDRLRLATWEGLSKLWQELQARRAAEAIAASPPAEREGTPVDKPPIRVLIVDDHAVTRENVRKRLESVDDIRVVGEATNGREAVELYDELLPDVVSMDINLPDIDGIAVTRLIRAKHKNAKVFMLTVQSDSRYVRAATEAGAEGYLELPPTREELIETVRRLAGRPGSAGR